jgi:hypothetical protein
LNHLHPQDNRVFEIARIPTGFPFDNNAHYPKIPIQEIESISILLIVNKESMMLDPFDWPDLKKDLIRWANAVPLDLLIPEWTDKLFLEGLLRHTKPVLLQLLSLLKGAVFTDSLTLRFLLEKKRRT